MIQFNSTPQSGTIQAADSIGAAVFLTDPRDELIELTVRAVLSRHYDLARYAINILERYYAGGGGGGHAG